MAGSPIVTILGGGISGLSAAYYLTRLAPNVKIRLLEASQRVGGWIKSSHIDNNKVLFEAGPRTLRPHGVGGTVLLDMIKDLELDQQVVSVPKSHPSAKKRYIEYKREINQLPSGLKDLIFELPPVMDSVIGSIITEPFQPPKQYNNKDDDDESIYNFIERRFNQHVALNLVGAITHGIYAGDCKELSIQSTFPFLAAYEKKYGSVIKGLIDNDTIQLDSQQELQLAKQCQSKDPTWHKKLQGASVIGLLPGLEALPKALYKYLDQQPNVEILLNQKVTQLHMSSLNDNNNNNNIIIKTNHHEQKDFETNHIISTLPSRVLHTLLPELPHLNYNTAVNVAVVNLAYPKDQIQEQIKDYDGFGFLTPHRDNPYPIKVPGLLGVIFDTNSMGIQDRDNGLIRITCMIGGSDWDLAFGNEKLPSTLSSHAFNLSKKAMASYLNINIEPSYYQTNLLNECLPQYLVGHPKRMLDLHHTIQQRYGHQLSVTGASYFGVSVGDCVKNSRLLVDNLVSRGTLGDQSMFVTGLEKSLQSFFFFMNKQEVILHDNEK